jgi:CheY-like chemotaxis protein
MPEPSVILLAEDRDDDIHLIRKAFARAYVTSPLHIVKDGEETVAYLKGEGKYSNRAEYPLPDLLLLDLKMPRMDGFEVLKWIRQQPELSTLRVVVLTSSEDMRDVNVAYKLGANSFMVKPMDFQNFVEMSKFLSGYWLRMSKAPDTARPSKNVLPEPDKRS